MPLFEQLVVGAAGDDLDLESGNGGVVDDSAQRARRENVGLGAEDRVAFDDRGTG